MKFVSFADVPWMNIIHYRDETGIQQKNYKDSIVADTITKLVGEGKRFQGIEDILDTVSDSSNIDIDNNKRTNPKKLWRNWGNIDNAMKKYMEKEKKNTLMKTQDATR